MGEADKIERGGGSNVYRKQVDVSVVNPSNGGKATGWELVVVPEPLPPQDRVGGPRAAAVGVYRGGGQEMGCPAGAARVARGGGARVQVGQGGFESM